MKILKVLALCAMASLSACANYVWAPPAGAPDASYDQQAAQCRLFSRGATPRGGFIAASGKPAFVGGVVGGYLLASAIAGAVEANQNFNDCMAASGWTPVGRLNQTTTGTYVTPLGPTLAATPQQTGGPIQLAPRL